MENTIIIRLLLGNSGMRKIYRKRELFVRSATPRPIGTKTHIFLLCQLYGNSIAHIFRIFNRFTKKIKYFLKVY